MKSSKLHFVVAGILLGSGGIASADDELGFTPFTDSLLYLQLRPRFEYADVDGGDKAAKALTVRTVLGGEFGSVGGIKGLDGNLEATNVSHFGILDDYRPEQSGHDVIMDPTQTRITQSHLAYKSGQTTVIFGRKMLGLDNQRYIGHVGWRQMPQTYDMVAVTDNSIKNLNLTAGYVKRVNRITENGKLDTNSVVLNAGYTVAPELKVTPYAYLLSSIHDTFGIRATGSKTFSGVKLSYEGEYAIQNKATLKEESMGNVKPDHEADYYKLGVKANYSDFLFALDYEVLGEKEGSQGGAFNTPLATLHAMNGWADKFLSTPAAGLVDTSLTVGYLSKKYGRLLGFYHNFESDDGGLDYGSEFDLVYAYKLSKKLNLMVKGAFYKEGDDLKNGDTNKYWLMLDYKFSQ
ncbi:MAG TPA: hypothetical protein DCM38_05265 [Gammaproteobacteria bacterium]|nr:hypothetical protein [Gammaproteobacteria bacterium]